MMARKATGLMLGYVRVSTDGQSFDAQQADLKSGLLARFPQQKRTKSPALSRICRAHIFAPSRIGSGAQTNVGP
jgi:hypothetical protein